MYYSCLFEASSHFQLMLTVPPCALLLHSWPMKWHSRGFTHMFTSTTLRHDSKFQWLSIVAARFISFFFIFDIILSVFFFLLFNIFKAGLLTLIIRFECWSLLKVLRSPIIAEIHVISTKSSFIGKHITSPHLRFLCIDWNSLMLEKRD